MGGDSSHGHGNSRQKGGSRTPKTSYNHVSPFLNTLMNCAGRRAFGFWPATVSMIGQVTNAVVTARRETGKKQTSVPWFHHRGNPQ
jgi:hypothetical protein